ncbi:hypothetical protein [Streptomyces sp. NPDC056361]|uniref:hypothetical protein n=1 Tax=Streptomyces sp. NPDC056361 TaxID=3345795 RepID=UPI0035DC8947
MGEKTGKKAEPVRPRARTWVWVTVLVTAFCGGPVALFAWFVTGLDDVGMPKPAACSEVMAFAHGSLPADAEDARCTEAHFQDTTVEAEFRMPRAGVGAWLKATYPTGEPALGCEQGRCVDVSYDDALYVRVRVTYEDGATALVRVEAFDL